MSSHYFTIFYKNGLKLPYGTCATVIVQCITVVNDGGIVIGFLRQFLKNFLENKLNSMF